MSAVKEQPRADNDPPVDRWGFIDRAGAVAIPFEFDFASPHSEGLAAVRRDGRVGCVDRAGRWVIPLGAFESLGGFREKLCSAERDGKRGFIDRTGHWVIPPTFNFCYSFQEGLSKTEAGGRLGYIDGRGEWVIPPRFEFAENFIGGFAVVRDPDEFDDMWYLDRAGRMALGPFGGISAFSEGWGAVADERGCRFIDATGNTILRLPPQVYARRFREGLAAAEDHTRSERRMGYIDRQGEWVIPPQFDFTSAFVNGLATVEVADEKGLIDKAGRYVVPLQAFRKLDDPYEGRIAFAKPGELGGYMDERGRVVINPAYRLTNSFSEGLAAVALGK